MKKLLLVLVSILMALTLVACGSKEETPEAPAPETDETSEATYTLGLGVVTSLDSSSETNAQVDATFAAVVLDEDGKIVTCRLDAVQNKMDTEELDLEATFLTKVEKGDNYNMVAYSEATLEWYEQAQAFEAYVVGMTGAEVAAMPTRVRGEDEAHPGYVVTADEELFASCSIQITDFIAAIAKACADDQATTFTTADTFKVGVGANSTVDAATVEASDEENGLVCMYSEFAAVVTADGKVLAALNDAIQPKIAFDEDGVLLEESTFNGTKRELKEGYNMVAYSEATNEWYQQSASFSAYCVGKTADEIANLPTRVRGEDEAHPGYVVTADEELFASCSINITGMMAVVAKAANNAR